MGRLALLWRFGKSYINTAPNSSRTRNTSTEPEINSDDEERLLSQSEGGLRSPHLRHKFAPVTRLPLRQVLCLLLLAVAESIQVNQPVPYIPKLVDELGVTGGDKRKVGYYVGLFDTSYSITEAIFVLQWSRLSDRHGRKPILLRGIMGLAFSSILFGLSRTYLTFLFSRALAGVLSANFTILRGTVAELLDSEHFPRIIPWLAIMWSAGGTIGPLIGGTFYHPYDRLGGFFRSSVFWQYYPYFLPCLISAIICVTTFVVAFYFFKETLHTKRLGRNDSPDDDGRGRYHRIESRTTSSSPPRLPISSPLPLSSLTNNYNRHPSLGSLLTEPSLLMILANCAVYACLDVAVNSILPIYLSSPRELGGLGLNPSQIGIVMAIISTYNSLFQVFFFAKIHARWGSRRMLQAGMLNFVAIFLFFPLCIWTMKDGNIGLGTWIIMILQIGLYPISMMIASCLTMLLASVAPPGALGTVNGLGHNSASVFRILGPATITSVYALSVEKRLAGGSLAYYLACIIAVIGYLIGGLVAIDNPTSQTENTRFN